MSAFTGAGTSSSPILIEDSDDERVGGTPRRSSLLIPALSQQTIRPRIEKEDPIVGGKGHDMVMRMGFQPGSGLGLNLEGAVLANTGSNPTAVNHLRRPVSLTAALATSYTVTPVKENVHEGRTANGKNQIATRKQKKNANAVLCTQVNHGGFPASSEPILAQKRKEDDFPKLLENHACEAPNQSIGPADARLPHHAHSPQPIPQGYEAVYDPPSPISPDLFPFPVTYQQSQWPPQSFMTTMPIPYPFFENSHSILPPEEPAFSMEVQSLPFPSHTAGIASLPPKPPPRKYKPSRASYDKARITYIPEKGMIGVGQEPGRHRSFAEPNSSSVHADSKLVLEGVPRKYRTNGFIDNWLEQFGGLGPVKHFQLAGGRVGIEFASVEDASRAFKSPRMGGSDGLTGVRARWCDYDQDHGQHQSKAKGHAANIMAREQTFTSDCALPPLHDDTPGSNTIVPDAWTITEQAQQCEHVHLINRSPAVASSDIATDPTPLLVSHFRSHMSSNIVSRPASDSLLSDFPALVSSHPHDTPLSRTTPSSPPGRPPAARVPTNSLTPRTKKATIALKVAAAKAEMSAIMPLSSAQELTSSNEENMVPSKRKRMADQPPVQAAFAPVADTVVEEFIRDAISHQRASKRIKFDPEELKEHHHNWEKHLEACKQLIELLDNPDSKGDRPLLTAQLKIHSRAAQREKCVVNRLMNANSVWPEMPEACVVDISDSEDEDYETEQMDLA
ncbi:hypothetical protein OF83DRAFT_1091355 [Amylostereum chailletii]|nr:hypothetical protein OF83DRAFT_1091355 [Amylostereum chailletii]